MEDKVICEICNWSWEIEADDDHPHLCHKCGFDNKKKIYNFEEYNKWMKNHQNERRV
jgi:hypothetical protein